jgi:hypothetical protein
MSWFGDVLFGFFTRHLTTKLLALLLCIGLFLFVQNSLTTTQELTRLDLVPSLGDDLRPSFVLLSSAVSLNPFTITGERSKVDPLARLYKTNALRLPINLRLLNIYGKKQESGLVEIPIDEALFRDDLLFGKDILVSGLAAQKLSIRLSEVTTKNAVRVEVDAGLKEVAVPGMYEKTFAFTTNVTSVDIRGPSVAFLDNEPKVIVTMPKLQDRIAAEPVAGETGTLKLTGCEIDWAKGGIAPEYASLLRITITNESGGELSASQLQQRLVISTEVTKKREKLKLKDVPIQIRYPVPQQFDLLKVYSILSPFIDSDLSNGYLPFLDVKLPTTLKGNEDFLKNLVVILDVAEARPDLDKRLLVPFYLSLKDTRRATDRANLLRVEIDGPTDAQFNTRADDGHRDDGHK